MVIEPLARLFLPSRNDEKGEGGGQGAGEGHVRDINPCLQEKSGGGAEDERRENPGPAAEELPADMVGEKDGQKAHERSRKTGGEFVLAKDGERESVEPVVQRRLLEIFYIVEERRYEIAAFEHFARYLRIAPLVRLDQGNAAEE